MSKLDELIKVMSVQKEESAKARGQLEKIQSSLSKWGWGLAVAPFAAAAVALVIVLALS